VKMANAEAGVTRVLLEETFSSVIVASKQKACMVIAGWNHVRSAFNLVPLEAHMKFWEFRPMDPGMFKTLEVKNYLGY
jgi:hypothetical protein